MCDVAVCTVDINEVFKEFQKIYLKINISYYRHTNTFKRILFNFEGFIGVQKQITFCMYTKIVT